MIRILVSVILIASGCVIVASRMKSTSIKNASRKVMFANFGSDIANMVYAWDSEDPRSNLERRQALFEFIYQGYDSSVWIPQSLFDNNLIAQAVVGDTETIVRDRIGLVLWPENKIAVAYGMAPNWTPDKPLSWTLNCVACHMAEIDGVAYFGAGAKVLDEKTLADSVTMVTNSRGPQAIPRDSIDHQLASHAHDVMERHHHEQSQQCQPACADSSGPPW